jgi:hypothetical protein
LPLLDLLHGDAPGCAGRQQSLSRPSPDVSLHRAANRIRYGKQVISSGGSCPRGRTRDRFGQKRKSDARA